MSRALLFQLDGKVPNIALMRIAAHHRVYRQAKLREFGCRPYPMPFVRSRELVGFQRWVIGAYDKRFSWEQWEAARYRPENL